MEQYAHHASLEGGEIRALSTHTSSLFTASSSLPLGARARAGREWERGLAEKPVFT